MTVVLAAVLETDLTVALMQAQLAAERRRVVAVVFDLRVSSEEVNL